MKSFKITKSITNRDNISLNLYLKEISKQPLISSAEEVKLAQRIHEGDTQALSKLVNANLRFVVSVAKQYQNQGVPLVDLISEGNIGLIKAAKKFDETKGFKFISYAVWWIRQSILQSLADKGRTIRLPLNQVSTINKINKTSSKFEQMYERAPSMEELEEELNIPASKISNILSAATKCLSVDTPFKDEEEGCLLDIIPNDNSPKTDYAVIKESISQGIQYALNSLTGRDRDIIMMLYGIGVKEMSLEEVGNKFGVTSERIRQIREKSLKLLRNKYKNKETMLTV